MGLADIYDATARSMSAKFDGIRSGLQHSGARGSAVEEIVRDFLRQSLPASLGVTSGQVVDSEGSFSNQSDVIIYNAQRTPMLFRSTDGGEDVVPAEGVVAVVEVKSHLQRKDISQLLESAQKLKRLKRTCYAHQAISSSTHLYDQSWVVPPPTYTVFAFKSDGLYVSELNEAQSGTPLHERIDNLCALDRGFVINVGVTGHVSHPETLVSYLPTATTHGAMAESLTDQPLLPWYLMNSTIWNQFDYPPILLLEYFQDRLKFGVSTETTDMSLYKEIERQTADHIGLSVELARRLTGQDPGGVSLRELVDIADLAKRGLVDTGRPDLQQIIVECAEVPPEERLGFAALRVKTLRDQGVDPFHAD